MSRDVVPIDLVTPSETDLAPELDQPTGQGNRNTNRAPGCATHGLDETSLSRRRISMERYWINPRANERAARRLHALASCRHQPSFLDFDARARRAQAGRIEIRPNLVGAVATGGLGGRPAGLARGERLIRLHFRYEHGQGNRGHSEEREDRERSERSGHWGLLTVAGRRSRYARGSIDNAAEDARFQGCRRLFGYSWQASAAICAQKEAAPARGDTLRPPCSGRLWGMGSASGRAWTTLSADICSGWSARIRLNQVNKVRALLTAS